MFILENCGNITDILAYPNSPELIHKTTVMPLWILRVTKAPDRENQVSGQRDLLLFVNLQ